MLFKKIFTLFGLIALFLGLQQLIEKQTHGFYLQKILAHDIASRKEWQNLPPSIDVLTRLDQPYYFLGAGSECYAFLSADGKSVIKFFKLDKLRPVYLLRGLFLEDYSAFAKESSCFAFIKRILGMRAFRIQRTFNSLKLSHDYLKEETGILYLHLSAGDLIDKKCTLYDPCGIAHTIDLNQTHFYLQECATTLTQHFLILKEKGGWEEACRCVDSLCELIVQRALKGFADRDPRIKNFGFIGQRALEIDAGSFIPSIQMREPQSCRQELFYATRELDEWAQKNYPDLASYLSLHLENLLKWYTFPNE
jgi:hypothetical protein